MTNINKENKVNPKDLLTHNRLDIAFKYVYLKFKKCIPKFSKELYKHHIYAITNGLYREGNTTKDSFQKFVSSFDKTFKSIKENGFDPKISTIPITANNTITNGSHRLASAIYLDKNVPISTIDEKDSNYNYSFFLERGIDLDVLEFTVLNYLLLKENIYLALIWPSATKKVEYISNFKKIIYQKSFKLNPKGAHNLLAQIYKEQNWIGNFETGYGGTYLKLNQAFKSFSPVNAIFFHESSIENVTKIKKQIREKFQIGKASIHITDNKNQTIELAKYILNKNSLHFLNNAQPYKFQKTYNQLKKFRSELINNNINQNDIVIDGGSILSIYGIRESNDLDYLISDKSKYQSFADNHIDEIVYHKETLDNLIYNPRFYFYFNDFKFISLDQLKRMKKNRASTKDLVDIKLINSQNIFKIKFLSKLHQLYTVRFKIIAFLIPFTKKIGLYNIAKKIYKLMFKI